MIKIILCSLLILALFIWNDWNNKQIEKEMQEENITHPPMDVESYNAYIESLKAKGILH